MYGFCDCRFLGSLHKLDDNTNSLRYSIGISTATSHSTTHFLHQTILYSFIHLFVSYITYIYTYIQFLIVVSFSILQVITSQPHSPQQTSFQVHFLCGVLIKFWFLALKSSHCYWVLIGSIIHFLHCLVIFYK